VLFVVWNLIRGGTEGQCARVAIELARGGCPPRVAVLRREGFFLPAVESACGPLYHLDICRLVSAATRREVRRLAAFLRAERFDLVHTWDADASIFAGVAARAAGVPLITSRRDLGEIYPWYKLWLMNRSDRHARAVVVNAEAIAQRLRMRGVPDGLLVRLTNILDVDEFDRLAADPLPPYVTLPAGRLMVMVARLDPEKDGTTLIAAASVAMAGRPDVHLVVAGDGPERGRLEQQADELGCGSRVHFLGDVTCVPALLRRCDVGVLVPKANEGLSNTLLEYMAAGLPIVATDCGGNKELVEHERNGFITGVGDADAIARAMASLLDDPARRKTMGRWSRERVERCNRPDTVARQYGDLYRRVAR
jgi:glycosyltransferase involved in cell wall biosynthesis